MPIEYWLRLGTIYSTIASLPYSGTAVECPCCKGRFRKFRPGGVVRRPNAVCPRCGSLERHRLLMLYLQRETSLFRDRLRLLHVAPEPPLYTVLSRLPNLTYVPAGQESALARVPMDITNITYSDASFDAVICVHVLEHVPDDRRAMAEFHRVLRPGGWAILQVPVEPDRAQTYEDWTRTTPAQRFQAFGQEDHIRVYGRDYVDRLRASGFDVTIDDYPGRLPSVDVARYGLSTCESVYLCRKQSDPPNPAESSATARF